MPYYARSALFIIRFTIVHLLPVTCAINIRRIPWIYIFFQNVYVKPSFISMPSFITLLLCRQINQQQAHVLITCVIKTWLLKSIESDIPIKTLSKTAPSQAGKFILLCLFNWCLLKLKIRRNNFHVSKYLGNFFRLNILCWFNFYVLLLPFERLHNKLGPYFVYSWFESAEFIRKYSFLSLFNTSCNCALNYW